MKSKCKCTFSPLLFTFFLVQYWCGDIIMHIINDIVGFLKTLSFVDVVFFFAVLALMLLIITLIYFIRENQSDDNNILPKDDNKKEQIIDNSEIGNLKEITKALEEASQPAIDLNKYEEDQEEKAIISYDELLKKKNNFALNYLEEENIDDDLTIKKVNLDNLFNKEVPMDNEIKVTVISYDKEEAFLEALKSLQQKLN